MPTNDFSDALKTLQASLKAITRVREDVLAATAALDAYENETTAEIAKYLRASASGLELDVDAIKATVNRPYTLLPAGEHEAHLIHWRGIRMPIFGWVLKQEPAFVVARVSRSMDLLTPLPEWMKSELGWKPPEYTARIDGTRTSVTLTSGDDSAFRRKYGNHLGKKNADGSYAIKGGDAWIKLVAQLVRDGILPYAATPVSPEHWVLDAQVPPVLADIISKKQREAGDAYIDRAVDEFHAKGAVLVNYPPGAGKTLTSGKILNYFRGRVLILADTTILVEQWQSRLKLFAPDADATISTYQGAGKYLEREWDLIIFDEAQRLPANTFSKLAFAKTKYRLALTGTPWREDNRQHLIVALAGFPVALRWSKLIASGVLKRPRIVVATVPNEGAKTAYTKSLVAKARGRVLIFCDWIEQGQALANALSVPFIHGETRNKLAQLQDAPVAVVSRIGDRGLDLPDLKLVVEVAGQGAAREQFAQRVGRLLHGNFEGEFHTVFTPEEATRNRARVFGVEAELAGEVEIEFVSVGNVPAEQDRAVRVRPRTQSRATTYAPAPKRARPSPSSKGTTEKPKSEAERALELPAIRGKVAEATAKLHPRAAANIPRLFRLCFDQPLSIRDMMDALAIRSSRPREYMTAAAKEMVKVGILKVRDDQYEVPKSEIERARMLARLTQ